MTNQADEFDGYDDGPQSRQNWLAMLAGRPYTSIEEYPLYTDSHVTGEVEYGPYGFLNTVPLSSPDTVQPAIILRCRWHLGRRLPAVDPTK